MSNNYRENERQSNGNNWLFQYDLLRVILVIFVVIGHASFITIRTKYGSIEYGLKLTESGYVDSVFHQAVSLLSSWIYSFHMPLFIALSGTIYEIYKKSSSYKSFSKFVISKSKRLLIPFVVVWWLYRFPIMQAVGFYNGIPKPVLLFQMFEPNCVYLWYLEALFIIFIIIWGLDTIKNKRIETIIIICLYLIGLFMYWKFYDSHYFGDPLYYLLWFYIGMYAEDIVKKLEEWRILTKQSTMALLIIQIVLFVLINKLALNKLINSCIQYIVLPFLMCIVLYFFVIHYQLKNKKNSYDVHILYGYLFIC